MERLKRLLRGDVSERTSRMMKVVAVVVLLLMLFILAMSRVRGTTMSTVRDSYNNFFSSVGGGGGYPYQVDSSNVKKVDGLRQGDPLVRPLLRDTGPRQEPRPGARLRPGREPLPGREPDGVPLRGHDGRRRGHHHRQYRQQGEHRPRNTVRLRHFTADGLEQHL